MKGAFGIDKRLTSLCLFKWIRTNLCQICWPRKAIINIPHNFWLGDIYLAETKVLNRILVCFMLQQIEYYYSKLPCTRHQVWRKVNISAFVTWKVHLALIKGLYPFASSNELKQIIAKFDEQEKRLLMFHPTFDLAPNNWQRQRCWIVF